MIDLIKRLRDTASKGVSVWGDLQMEAADEIERLRDCDTFERGELEHTIDALVAEVEDVTSMYNRCVEDIHSLRAKVNQAEPVKFLANGTRFKTSEYPYGVCINGLPKELSGRWVALVAAEDDCHLKLTAPQGQTPTDKDSLTVALLKQALEALEEATTYTSTPAWSPSMTRDCEIVVANIKQHLGEV